MPSPKTRAEVISISNRVADEWKIPRLLMLAVGVAESNLRWDARRPADPKDDERFWPDVSGGVWQQTVRYDPEYTGGGTYSGASEIARILERQYDVERSAHVAAANLKAKLSLERADPLTAATDDEILLACYRYNWPGGAGKPYSPAHEQNYRRGLVEAKNLLAGGAPLTDVTAIQQQVIALGKAETGKPYSGPIVGQPDSARYGNPGYDCSSFVSEMYKRATGGQVKLTPFTDAAYGQCEWSQTPQPGDVVFYHYPDASQPGVTFPHMGIWLSPTEVLDCRYPEGVGVHPHVTPISDGARYRRTMRPKGLANVTSAAPAPAADQRDALIAQLRADLDDARMKLGVITVGYAKTLQDVVDAIRSLKPSA